MRSASQRQEPCPASLCVLSVYGQTTCPQLFANQCMTECQAPWQGGGGWPEMPCWPAPVGDAAWTVWLRLWSEPNPAGRGRPCRGLDRDGGVTVPRRVSLCFPPPESCSKSPQKRQFRVSSKGINPQGREGRGGKSSDTILGAGRWRVLGTDGEIWEGCSSAHGGGGESDWHHRTEPPAGFWKPWTKWD